MLWIYCQTALHRILFNWRRKIFIISSSVPRCVWQQYSPPCPFNNLPVFYSNLPSPPYYLPIFNPTSLPIPPYLFMLIVAVPQADPKSGLTPVLYPDYSTFPPTYSLRPPSTAPPAYTAPMLVPVLPRPVLKWASAPSAQLTTPGNLITLGSIT